MLTKMVQNRIFFLNTTGVNGGKRIIMMISRYNFCLLLVFRDENRVKTDGTKWCNICFHIFMQKQKRI
jgi:hypothetical protein